MIRFPEFFKYTNSIHSIFKGNIMKKLVPYLFLMLVGLVTQSSSVMALIKNVHNVNTNTDFATIQLAVASASASDVLNISAGTFTENVVVDKAVTLNGVGSTTIITPATGTGISVTAAGVTIQNLVVRGAVTGISAVGLLDGLTITSVTVDANTGEGMNIVGLSNVTLTTCTATGNGAGGDGSIGSGVDIVGVATATVNGLTATGNKRHGLAIGAKNFTLPAPSNNLSSVSVSGGTFNGNGNAGKLSTGSGIAVFAEDSKSVMGVTINGVTASNNTTAGIFVDASAGTISTTNIGQGSDVTCSNNGSTGADGTGGAGVVVFGPASTTNIKGTFAKGSAPGAGVVVVGVDGIGFHSPTATTIANSSFSAYTESYPAITRTTGTGTISPGGPFISTQVITATTNTFTFPVTAKVYLQAAYTGSGMSTLLNSGGYLPTAQPYNDAANSYAGGEVAVSIPATVTDWVLVELRTTSGGTAVSRKAAFLKNDGTLMSVNGSAGVSMTVTEATGYNLNKFVVIKHRTHLAVMSAAAVSLPNASTVYDFTTGLTQYFGGDAKSVSGGKFAMYGGDTNQDGLIDGSDFLAPDNKSGLDGYLTADANMDGIIDGSDFLLPDNNSGNITRLP
jgi:Right handed beta helix region